MKAALVDFLNCSISKAG